MLCLEGYKAALSSVLFRIRPLSHHFRDDCSPLFGEHFKNMVADHLVCPVASQPLVRRADIGDMKIAVRLPHHIGYILCQQAIEGLAVTQLFCSNTLLNSDAGQTR